MTGSRTLEAKLLLLEQQLLTPSLREDRAAAGELLADEFIEIGKSGRTFDKQQVLQSMHEASLPSALTIEQFQVRQLAPTVVLVNYLCGNAKRSSIWRESNDQWQMVFHQATPAARSSP